MQSLPVPLARHEYAGRQQLGWSGTYAFSFPRHVTGQCCCCLCVQGDESRAVFKFTPLIAPVKATVFPLLQKQQLNEPASALSQELTAVGLSNIVDTTGGSVLACDVCACVCVSVRVAYPPSFRGFQPVALYSCQLGAKGIVAVYSCESGTRGVLHTRWEGLPG